MLKYRIMEHSIHISLVIFRCAKRPDVLKKLTRTIFMAIPCAIYHALRTSAHPWERITIREKNAGAKSRRCARRDDKETGGIEKFKIKRLKVRQIRRRSVENNGTEGARGPIETTIYRRPLLSIIAPDGNADRTWRKVVLSVAPTSKAGDSPDFRYKRMDDTELLSHPLF